MTVDELEFKDHPSSLGGEHASCFFDNGYGASVLFGGPFYTDNGTYEIAVLSEDGEIDYSTPVTDDVLGYLTVEEANQALEDISNLPKREASE